MVKIIGLDYGSKITGIAEANIEKDKCNLVAFPVGSIETKKLRQYLEKLINDGVKLFVVGKSVNLKGDNNALMQSILKLKQNLEEKNVKVILIDERYTTSYTISYKKLLEKKDKRLKIKSKKPDAQAAAVILQTFLDRLK